MNNFDHFRFQYLNKSVSFYNISYILVSEMSLIEREQIIESSWKSKEVDNFELWKIDRRELMTIDIWGSRIVHNLELIESCRKLITLKWDCVEMDYLKLWRIDNGELLKVDFPIAWKWISLNPMESCRKWITLNRIDKQNWVCGKWITSRWLWIVENQFRRIDDKRIWGLRWIKNCVEMNNFEIW